MSIMLTERDERGHLRVRELDGPEIRQIMAPATAPVDAEGFCARRRLPDGRWLAVIPLLGERARLGFAGLRGECKEQPFLAQSNSMWDYPNRQQAISALMVWDGEGAPPGGERSLRTYR
jgi:hypothetical protein